MHSPAVCWWQAECRSERATQALFCCWGNRGSLGSQDPSESAPRTAVPWVLPASLRLVRQGELARAWVRDTQARVVAPGTPRPSAPARRVWACVLGVPRDILVETCPSLGGQLNMVYFPRKPWNKQSRGRSGRQRGPEGTCSLSRVLRDTGARRRGGRGTGTVFWGNHKWLGAAWALPDPGLAPGVTCE